MEDIDPYDQSFPEHKIRAALFWAQKQNREAGDVRLRRERIATAALQGLLAGEIDDAMVAEAAAGRDPRQAVVRAALGFADALIAALDEVKP